MKTQAQIIAGLLDEADSLEREIETDRRRVGSCLYSGHKVIETRKTLWRVYEALNEAGYFGPMPEQTP